MKIPEKLLYKGSVVATLYSFSYEFPWTLAEAKFIDSDLKDKIENLTAFRQYDIDLEEMCLPDKEEEALWENKLSELGLSHQDLKIDKEGLWSVICNDGTQDPVRAIQYDDGWLQWRA